jgi:hypothetical protein
LFLLRLTLHSNKPERWASYFLGDSLRFRLSFDATRRKIDKCKMYWLERSEAFMSNLSLARIMFGSSEEVRHIAGSGVTANVSSFAPVSLVPSVAAQAAPSHSLLPGVFRRIWLRLSAKS